MPGGDRLLPSLLIPYLPAAFSYAHCFPLQQVASDITGIFERANKLLVIHSRKKEP